MTITATTHVIVLVAILTSIYLLRYTSLLQMRQKTCSQAEIRDTVHITRKGTTLGKYTSVESGVYLLYFSQDKTPVIGSHIDLIGKIRDRSQCEKSAQIVLTVQDYSDNQKGGASPFSLLIDTRYSLETFTNSYLQKTEEVIYRFLPVEHARVLLGMTIGRKYSSQESISKAMSAAGLTHVLVASGANISLLTQFAHTVMRKIFSRKLTIIVSVIIAAVYTLIVGYQAPILRAFFMFCCVSLAALTGRKTPWYYPLGIGGFVLLIYQPFFLFSLSFWLTIAASAAVLLDLRIQEPDSAIETSAIYLEFQRTLQSTGIVFLFTLPLILFFIGKTTLVTLISSVLLLWLVAPITILGMLFLLLGWLIPGWFIGFFYLLLWFPLEVFIRFVHLLSAFSFLSVTLQSPTILGFIVYYMIIIIWVLFRIAKVDTER